jgi:hypothetical protein
MVYESLSYKGYEIKIFEKDDEEYFSGCYVKTIWFPTVEKAKEFIDRLTVHQDMGLL